MEEEYHNLTIEEALSKLLEENKSLLNNGNALMTALNKCVAPEHKRYLQRFEKPLVQANIGEFLLSAKESEEYDPVKTKEEAIARLKEKYHLLENISKFVVEKLMAEIESKRTAEFYYNKGIVNIQEKEYDQALENFNQAIELDPTFADAYGKRAMVYAITEHYDKAIPDYTEVIKLDSQNISAYRERGKCYDALSQYEAALKDCEKVLQLDPSDKSVEHMRLLLIEKYYNDGITDLNKKNYSKAIKNFSRVIELNPTFAEAYIKRGRCYYEVKQYKSASEDLEQAYKLAPNDEHIRSMHKILHERLAASNGGKAALKTALKAAFKEESKPSLAAGDDESDSDESDSGKSGSGKSGSGESGDSKSGGSESDSGKSDSSKSVWQENGFKDKFFKFSGRLNRKQYIIRALSICLMSIIIIVVLTLIHDNFSTMFIVRSRKDVIMFSNIIAVILSIPMGISLLSLLKRRWQDLGKPLWWILTCFIPPVFAYLILFKKGTNGENKYGPDPLGKTNNTNPDFNQNEVIKKTKKIVAGIVAGVILISLGIAASIYNDRNLAREHNDNGLAYQSQKRYDEALEEFEQSIKLYPEYAEAYYNRGFVYCKKNDYDKALTDFNRVIELDLNYVEAYCFRGVAYSRKKNYDKALLDFKRALELDPEYPKVYCERAMVYYKKMNMTKLYPISTEL